MTADTILVLLSRGLLGTSSRYRRVRCDWVKGPIVPQLRLRGWALSGLILVLAFPFAVAACASGMWLVATLLTEGIEHVEPRSFFVAVIVLIACVIAALALVTLSVVVVAGDRIRSLWHERRHSYRRLHMRTLMAAVVVFATVLGMLVFAGRAFDAYRATKFHADSAQKYRWLQGLDSDFGVISLPRFPASGFWTPDQLEYLREMERYHQGLSQEYHAAASQPWLAMPPDPPEPQKPPEDRGALLTRLSDLIELRKGVAKRGRD
jgi:hypothetical protein